MKNKGVQALLVTLTASTLLLTACGEKKMVADESDSTKIQNSTKSQDLDAGWIGDEEHLAPPKDDGIKAEVVNVVLD